MRSHLGPELERAIGIARAEARHQRSSILSTPHLFIALTKLDGPTAAALRAHGQNPKTVRDGLRAALGHGDAPSGTERQITRRADPRPEEEEQPRPGGPAGVGKAAIVEGLAQRIVDETASVRSR